MALSPDEKFIYVNPDTTSGEYNTAQYFPVKYLRGLECIAAASFLIYFRGPKDAKSTRVTVSMTSGFIKDFFTQFVDEVNFGENAVITLADRNIATDATTGGTDFQHVNAFEAPVILSDVTFSGYEDVQVAEDLDVAGTITGDLTGDVTGDVTGTASIATSVTVADESTDASCFPLFSTAATGNLQPKSGSNLTFNSSSGLLTATSLAGTLTTAAQTNITSLGTLTALDVDDINLNGKTITITGDTDDTFSIVAGANGATTLTTVDTADALGHFEIAADGNITLDAAGDIALEAAGNDITIDSDTLTIESSSLLSPFVTLKSTGSSAFASYFAFSKQRADDSPADNDTIGSVIFSGEDAAGSTEGYGSIVGSIIEADHGDEAGKIQILVANDGTERNGITMSGDKGTAAEVDVTIANGAASVTTIAGTLTMGSTAALTNAGLVAVANQSNITGVGTISSGVWEGTTIKTAYIGDDQVTEAKLANTLLAEIDANTAKVTNSDQSKADINALDITEVGTIDSGVWQGTAIASAYLDADTAHLSGAQSFTGLKTFSAGIIPSFVKHSISGNNAGDYGPGAEILFGISAETTTAGAIYVLQSGVWVLMDADDADRCRQLAAVAVGTNSSTHGMLIKGCVTLAADYTAGTDAEGIRVFASTTAGEATLTAPSASGDTVRILGYSLNAGDQKMFFNPDSTHVEIA